MSGTGLVGLLLATCVLGWAVDPPMGSLRRRPRGAASDRTGGRSGGRRSRIVAGVATGLIVVMAMPGLIGWSLALLLGATAAWAMRWAEPRASAQERHRLALQLPHSLDLLAAVLAAGLPLRSAVDMVATVAEAPTATLLRDVCAQVDIGIPESRAWRSLIDHPVWGGVARDIARSSDSGTALAQVLSVHARDARSRRRLLLQGQAHRAGVHAVLPLVCCYLPAFILVGVVPIIAGSLGQFFRP